MLIEQITKRFKKKIIETKIEDIKFRWEFEDFFDVLNINNFLTMMQHQLKVTYNFNQEQDVREKIILIRDSITSMTEEIKDIEFNIKEVSKLDNLLHMFYLEIKEIINNSLITYLFYEKIHCSVEYKNNIYDTEDFFKLKLMLFKENLLKHSQVFIKSLNRADQSGYSF
ncbi:hypothetical protein [Spiroplasma sp. BIUS-1]|uniref:hypothetical protein n=1 Tax=Spiroplasma sp. BIUS-1 TaxID=216964 RepID=UPI001398382C|nr:hypothetical protein [Spiroplasma sp. BIUS-1]QHX36872.1 hypothetical protein SBIUS_v1c06190 [Spiroplasma sp. BIUS-1]